MNAVITGGSQGVGFAIAQKLSLTYQKICIVSRSIDTVRINQMLNNNNAVEISTFRGDISKGNFVKQLEKFLKKSNFGTVNTLICNAGGPPPKLLTSTTDEDWDIAIQTCLLGQIRLVRSLIPGMIKSNHGRIVFISSTVAREPTAEMILSATARAGLSAFAKAASNELAKFDISLNVVYLGGILTERLNSLIEHSAKIQNKSPNKVEEELLSKIPAGRFASPNEVADLVSYLVSESAGYITGSSIAIDGGLSKGFF
jgi:3-oxoacyl-[acyl-carrier protein] reductase